MQKNTQKNASSKKMEEKLTELEDKIIKFLESKDIHSLYHRHFSEQQGKETQPTFYLYRHKDKPYHIDYCFVSNNFLRSMNGFKIGRYEEWKMYSDHMPLEVSFS